MGAPAASPAPAPSPSPSAPARDRFEASLRLQGSYDDNVLRTEPRGEGQYVGDATAALGYRHRWRRSWLSFGGHASAQRYSIARRLDRTDYGGEGTLALTLFRRTKLTLDQTYASSYTRDIPALASAGLVLPLVVANRAESTVQFERPFASRWRFDTDAQYERVDFPSRALSKGEEVTVFSSVHRRLRRHHWLTLGYEFAQGWSSGLDGARVHGILAGIKRQPPRGFRYVLLGGDAYLEGTHEHVPIGTAELSLNRRQDHVTVHYDRRVRHVFGLGRMAVTDLVSLDLSRNLTRHLSLGATGTMGIHNDPRDPGFRFRSDTYTGLLQWAVTSDLTAAAGFSHWRSTVGRGLVTPSNRGWFSMGYRVRF
jgi:hypothetical protein